MKIKGKTFKDFICNDKINEALSNIRYTIPKNKSQLLFDFYTMSGLPVWALPDHARHRDDIIYAHDEIKGKLLPYLKKHLLEMVEFSISAEFRHVFSTNTGGKIIKTLNKKFVQDYYTAYKALSVSTDPDLLNFIVPADRFKEDSRGYLDSWKARKTTKISSQKFIDLAEKAFGKLKWSSSYGGLPWVNICKGWKRLNVATSEGDLFVAIDHVYDLQHNTDTVFNKIKRYADTSGMGYGWIKTALDKKASAKSVLDFYDDVSKSLKPLMAFTVKAAYGTTVNSYLKNVPVTAPKNVISAVSNSMKSSAGKNSDFTWTDGIWKIGIFSNGTWKDGTWEKGIWESGIWENGVWKSGTWENGVWKYGTWKYGTWKYGTWKDGTWENGIWKNGTWENGIWKNGTWENGVWENGTWKDGTWENGTWKLGFIYDKDQMGNFDDDWAWSGAYVKSPISPKEYFDVSDTKSIKECYVESILKLK